jgi:hypothetical protein
VWRLDYSYDGQYIGDLFSITNGFSGSISRNGVGEIKFTISLRKLGEFCASKNFDVTRMFTPQKSTCKAVQVFFDPMTSQIVTGESLGGWLSKTPGFDFGASADTNVQLTFAGWLGLTAGADLIPPLTYNDNFNEVAQQQIEAVIERTILAGAPWPISVGTSDVLPVVSDTLEAPKTLKDFLLERADNTEGTGTFDVYADPSGEIALYEKYGVDISETTKFTYPDKGGDYGLKNIVFPEWDDFVSDVFLTGAGNGYASTTGAEGAAIFSEARNEDTLANTGYWQIATSQSDIADQTTLDAKATSYVKDTDKPFAVPTLKLDGDPFKIFDHDQGGDLWLGDVVGVEITDWAQPLIPLDPSSILRINSVDIAVDRLGHCDLSLGMMADG